MAKKSTRVVPLDPEQMMPPEEPEFEHFWDPDNEHDLQAMLAEQAAADAESDETVGPPT